jgi:ABC-2 type transport system permease protein
MTSEELSAMWLVLRREYLERVRSLSFLASTFAAPALFLAFLATPALLATPRSLYPKHILVVCSASGPARQIADTFRRWQFMDYHNEIVMAASPQDRDKLTAQVRESRIEGFLWLDNAAIASGQINYTSRSGLDLNGRESLRHILYRALVRARLAGHGLTPDAIDRSLEPVSLNLITLHLTAATDRSDQAMAVMVVAGAIITILEMSLLSYGIIVMRSVLEDKTSRMVEILLCSATPRSLMAGKILGIGGLSLTQVMIWSLLAAGGVAAGAWMLGTNFAHTSTLAPGSLATFAALYVFGYLLYSSLYAALGAAFNTADEGQYWSFILTLPLLFAGIAAWSLFERPDSAIAVALSLLPPLAPVMMSMRVVVGAAPDWQIALSLALMAGAIYIAWGVSARIYRVGTLMYGKKPTMREITRWLHYA